MQKVLIWGTGKYCERKYQEINKKFDIMGFVCNTKEDDMFHNKPVIKPGKINEYEWDSIIILSKFFFEIIKDIEKLKISSSSIILGCNYKPYVGIEKRYMGDGRNRLEVNSQYQIVYYGENENVTIIGSWDDLNSYMHTLSRKTIEKIRSLPQFPVERGQGSLIGKSVKRVYTEDYIKKNSQYIKGAVGEMESRLYTNLYGDATAIKESWVMEYHAKFPESEKFGLDIDLSNRMPEEMRNKFDCIICTHTLTYILNLQTAIDNFLFMVKPGGIILLTFAGMLHRVPTLETDRYKPLYGILPNVMDRLLEDKEIAYWEMESYGNLMCEIASLYGIPSEELSKEEIMRKDEDYPLIVGVRIVKGEK